MFQSELLIDELPCVEIERCDTFWCEDYENLLRSIGQIMNLNTHVSVPIHRLLRNKSAPDTVMESQIQSVFDHVKSAVTLFIANVFAIIVLRFGDGIVSSS